MIYMLYGAAGVLVVLLLLVIGFALGWSAHKTWQMHTKQAIAAEASEEERRALIAEQKAFENMLNYNTDKAYGLVPDIAELAGGESE